MQWGQLSRPYSSTDRSSSLGSMESLDTPTPTAQQYSDSHNSPVDPALFNNKRDSAYSSFSASSNTSDYATVPLRSSEACSMDNLLQSLGPACRGCPVPDTSALGNLSGEAVDETQPIVHKSRSLTRPKPRPVEVKERPSSCCYEKQLKGENFENVKNREGGAEKKINPPQPPTRKDSFRATRSRPNVANKRCSSAPIGVSSVSSNCDKNKFSLNVESGIHNGFLTPEDSDKTGNFKENSLDFNYIQRQTNDIIHIACGTSTNKDAVSDPLNDPVKASLVPIASCSSVSLPINSMDVQGQPDMHSETKHSSTALHRHSAPEKLLATQLQLLHFDSNSTSLEPYNQSSSNPADASFSPCSSQWSHLSFQSTREDQEDSHSSVPSNKWGGSRCSTPGSVFLEANGDDGGSNDRLEEMDVNGGSLTPVQHHHWGRSVSVPGEPSESSVQGVIGSDQILEEGFEPLSAAASMDTLLEEQRSEDTVTSRGKKDEDVVGESSMKKSNSSRNHRRNRRRSERFATNLRNEIQRKKAQLQSSRGPGGLLCSGETVQEEEGSDLHEEIKEPYLPAQERNTKVAFASPICAQNIRIAAPVEKPNNSSESNHSVLQIQPQSTTYVQNNNLSRSVQILDPGMASFGVGIRVVEEPAPAGKARRWRWTPEHKLQPEPEPERRCGGSSERVLGVTGSRHGVCSFTSSYTRSSLGSRMEDDILPFADRMKFFEQTSRGMSGSNISSLSSHRQKKLPNHSEQHGEEPGLHLTQRRYSYQGSLQEESSLLSNTKESRGQSVSTCREKEQAREERLRERERQQEKERQERELEMERARLREIQREREREERVRQWELEREREFELEREKEMERTRESERLKEREKELERERKKEREVLNSHQEFCGNSGTKERYEDFQLKENFHIYQDQSQTQVLRSAFYPVKTAPHPLDNQQSLHQGYNLRSYTPTEV